MSVDKFINLAKVAVRNYTNQLENVCKDIGINDIIVVWQCKTLQNHKALLITNLFDGLYYEVTYNGDKNEFYFDVYEKRENRCFKEDRIKSV